MTMLIRGGHIRTRTARGDLMGDILLRDGCIAAIAEAIPTPDGECCCIDAHGLTVLPGLIDAHAREPLHPGVTAGLRWPDSEGACALFTPVGTRSSRFYAIQPERYADALLHARLLDLAHEGFLPACEVQSEAACRRMLGMIHSTGVRVVLAGLQGCDALAEAIAIARAPVVADADLGGLAKLKVPGAFTADTLSAVTDAPARLLGLTDRGFLAPGAAADIVLCAETKPMDFTHVLTIAEGKIQH